MRRRWPAWLTSRRLAWLVAAAALAGVVPARAAPAITVQAQDCPGVDAREVERLLAIELAALPPAGPLDVTLACAGAGLRVTGRDPALGRALVRDVALGPPEPGRNRTIALLVSQLFLTSWAEEFLEHPGPRTPPPSIVAAPPAPPAGPVPSTWDLQLAAGARVRDWAAPAVAEQVALTGGRRAGGLRLLLTAGLERGSAGRTAGAAVWTIGTLGGGVGWSSAARGRLAFSAALTASVGLAQAHGDPASSAYAGSAVRGAIGQAELAAGPRLLGNRWRGGLELGLGATWPGATARVSGDRDVRLGGPWAGARLWIGWGGP